MSEIQEVVKRTMVKEKIEQLQKLRTISDRRLGINKKMREVKERKKEVERQVSRRVNCFLYPLVFVFIGLFIFFSILVAGAVTFPNKIAETDVTLFYDQSQLTMASNLMSSISYTCKAFNISSCTDEKIWADFFLFTSEKNLMYEKRETSHNKFQLRNGKYWTKDYFIRKGMQLWSNFCLISNIPTAAVRLYVSKGSYDLNNFALRSDMSDIFYTEYRVTKNKTCYNFSLLPDNAHPRNTIIFANKGGPPVFVNASFILHSTAFMTSKAVHTCRNTSYCHIPHSVAAKFVVMTFNTSDPEEFLHHLNYLDCIVEKLYVFLLWGGLFVASILLFTMACVCTCRKIFPQIDECFKEQFDSLDRELLLAQQSESETQLLRA